MVKHIGPITVPHVEQKAVIPHQQSSVPPTRPNIAFSHLRNQIHFLLDVKASFIHLPKEYKGSVSYKQGNHKTWNKIMRTQSIQACSYTRIGHTSIWVQTQSWTNLPWNHSYRIPTLRLPVAIPRKTLNDFGLQNGDMVETNQNPPKLNNPHSLNFSLHPSNSSTSYTNHAPKKPTTQSSFTQKNPLKSSWNHNSFTKLTVLNLQTVAISLSKSNNNQSLQP